MGEPRILSHTWKFVRLFGKAQITQANAREPIIPHTVTQVGVSSDRSICAAGTGRTQESSRVIPHTQMIDTQCNMKVGITRGENREGE